MAPKCKNPSIFSCFSPLIAVVWPSSTPSVLSRHKQDSSCLSLHPAALSLTSYLSSAFSSPTPSSTLLAREDLQCCQHNAPILQQTRLLQHTSDPSAACHRDLGIILAIHLRISYQPAFTCRRRKTPATPSHILCDLRAFLAEDPPGSYRPSGC